MIDITKTTNWLNMKFSGAIDAGDHETIKELLSLGVDPNFVWTGPNGSTGGWTNLMSAACQGHFRIVDLLLKAGVSVDARTDEGKNIFDLLDDEADPNVECGLYPEQVEAMKQIIARHIIGKPQKREAAAI